MLYVRASKQTWIYVSCRTAAMLTWPRISCPAVKALKTRLLVHCRSGTKRLPRRSNGESGCSLPHTETVWEASWSTWRVSGTGALISSSGLVYLTTLLYIVIGKVSKNKVFTQTWWCLFFSIDVFGPWFFTLYQQNNVWFYKDYLIVTKNNRTTQFLLCLNWKSTCKLLEVCFFFLVH